jgi:DNA-binding ferritin-like protein
MASSNLKLEAVGEEEVVEQGGIGELDSLVCLLFQARFVIHVFYLRVNGPGAYAAHLAFGDIYESIIDTADILAEQYQGITSQLIQFPLK